MNPCVVTRAVLTRLKVDTTLWSAALNQWLDPLKGGAHAVIGSISTNTKPYLVYAVDGRWDGGFRHDEGDMAVTLTVYDDSSEGTDRLEYMIDRIIGDAMLTSGQPTAPTYGLNRHLLVLPSLGADNLQGSVGGDMLLENVSVAPVDENITAATLVFSVRVSKVSTN